MITLPNDLAGLTLRDVLDRAGRALASVHGLAPAAGVQKAYDLSMAELVTLHDVHDLVPEVEAAVAPRIDPEKERIAAEVLRQTGFAPDAVLNAAESAAVVAAAGGASNPKPQE